MLPSVGATESPGDFLLDFHHPQITFGKVVIEGDVKVIEEGKDLLYVQSEEELRKQDYESFNKLLFMFLDYMQNSKL